MYPEARKDKLTVRELPDETLIYDLERHKAHCLNATSGLVWKHCDGRTSVAGLARIVQEKLHIAESAPVVQLALEQLSRRHLLEQPVEPLSDEERLSRREVLRRLAVAAVALPVAMTILAPKAQAQVSQFGASTGQPCGPGPGPACTIGKCCNGICRDTDSDENNCGQCGRACAQGQTCVAGSCLDIGGGA